MTYSQELRNIALEMYQSGISSSNIANELNINPRTVLNWIPKELIRSIIPPYSKEVIDKVLDMYNSGLSANNIAIKLGLNKKTVLRWIPKNLKRSVKDYDLGYERNHNFFRDIKSEQQAYFLGLITADGSISKTGTLGLELKHSDGYLIEKFRDLLSPNAKISFSSRTKVYKGNSIISETSYLKITSRHYLEDLARYDIVPNKTYLDIRLPIFDSNLMNHYIRGLFDGDGSVYTRSKYKSLLTVTFVGGELLLNQVKDYLKLNLDLKGNLNIRARQTNCFDFSLTTQEDIHKFKEYIYKDATIFLKRKHAKFYNEIIAT
jgi:hypothetical protein